MKRYEEMSAVFHIRGQTLNFGANTASLCRLFKIGLRRGDYKKIAVLKVREEEFPKNTLRKILRFKLDMSID